MGVTSGALKVWLVTCVGAPCGALKVRCTGHEPHWSVLPEGVDSHVMVKYQRSIEGVVGPALAARGVQDER